MAFRGSSLLALLLLLIAACGGDKIAGPDHSGRYALVSINGVALPIVLQDAPGSRLELTAGAITLRSDGSFEDRLDWTESDGTTSTDEHAAIEGDWRVVGSTLTMTYAGGDILYANLENGEITQKVGEVNFVYRR